MTGKRKFDSNKVGSYDPDQRWAINKEFLDEAIVADEQIILATPPEKVAYNAAPIVTSRNKIRDTHMNGNIMKEQKSVGFIGLGNMGHGIASNLLKAGYTTRVYNRTKEKAKDLVEQGAILVTQPSDVIESGGIVFTMLSDDSALREIAEVDENFVKKLHPGGIPRLPEYGLTRYGSLFECAPFAEWRDLHRCTGNWPT